MLENTIPSKERIITSYDLVQDKDILLSKATILKDEGLIGVAEFEKYITMFNRMYNKTSKLILKIELIDFNKRLKNMLDLTEVILWDVVRQRQMKDMSPINVRKYNMPKGCEA